MCKEPPPYCGSNLIFVTESLETGEKINLKMAAPFGSDDMIKRSLFGAIFGYKKSNSRSRASSIDHPEQPGPSWAPVVQVTSAAETPVQQQQPIAAGSGCPMLQQVAATQQQQLLQPAAQQQPLAADAATGYYPPYNPQVFPQPPLPVLTSQCPYRRHQQSYSSLAHQAHAPSGAAAAAPQYLAPPAPAPYPPVADPYAYAAPPPPYSQYPQQGQQHMTDYQRSKADIYREIVNECEEFERSNTTTPLVESSPATPSVQSPLAAAAAAGQWPMQHAQQHLQQLQQPINDLTNNLSMMDLPPASNQYLNLDQQKVANILQQQVDVKPLLGSQMSLEDLVKFVVQAVKDTGSSSPVSAQSPEEILRRKRQMNNEAAARYRKRQREEKEKQNFELDTLEQRNLTLKRTVEDMEREIAVLKKYVLERTANNVVPKTESD